MIVRCETFLTSARPLLKPTVNRNSLSPADTEISYGSTLHYMPITQESLFLRPQKSRQSEDSIQTL